MLSTHAGREMGWEVVIETSLGFRKPASVLGVRGRDWRRELAQWRGSISRDIRIMLIDDTGTHL
jgi:hypothetical protein